MNTSNGESEPRADFVSQYEQRRAEYERFAGKLSGLLQELVTNLKISYEALNARTKTVQSFAAKIRRSGKAYSDPLREVTDLVGVRIVVFYLEDADRVADMLEREFMIDRDNSVDKGKRFSPNEFGYRSLHYVLSLRQERCALTEWKPFRGFKAEIQIRTVLQHAWASASRAFDYIHEADIPTPLRRRLFRLAGMFELADEEFSSIRAAHKVETAAITDSLDRGVTQIEINLDSVREYLDRSTYYKKLGSIAKGIGFVVTAEWEEEETPYVARLVALAERMGLRQITDLAKAVEPPITTAKSYLDHLLKLKSYEDDWEVGIPFLALLLLIRSNPEKLDIDELLEDGWSKAIAERVLRAARRYADSSVRRNRSR